MNLVSMSAFGTLHGVSRQAVAKWKARGLLVFDGERVNVDASNSRLELLRKGGSTGILTTGRQPVAAGLTARPGESTEEAVERILISLGADMSIDEARRVKENYLALQSQLEYDREAGLVVEVSEIARQVGEDYAKVRSRLLSIPSEQAPRLDRCKSPAEIQIMLRAAIAEALEELVRDGA